MKIQFRLETSSVFKVLVICITVVVVVCAIYGSPDISLRTGPTTDFPMTSRHTNTTYSAALPNPPSGGSSAKHGNASIRKVSGARPPA